MPFRPRHSLLRVDVPALNSIDTSSVENLFGMWSVFSKTANAMEDGRRLENLSWRLWNREIFCCNARPRTRSPSPAPHSAASSLPARSVATTASDDSVPALSSSLDSASSCEVDEERTADVPARLGKARPELRYTDVSACRSRGREKHITPDALASIVASIKRTKSLEPIEFAIPSPLQPADPSSPSLSQEFADLRLAPPSISLPPTTPEQTTQPSMSTAQAAALESSASTFDINDDKASQSVGSESSSNTEMSTHSVVRGFNAPSSYRSQTNLAAQPTPILKTSPKYHSAKPKKKGAMFTIGTSSGEDESSFESHMYRSSLSESLKRGTSDTIRKQTSFRDEMTRGAENSTVFETDEEDSEVSESAIEDDDDSSDWEDSEDQSRPSSVNEKDLFQRVDSRPDLTSRRSLLTTLMHEPDRAKALANAASRSTPAMRRSRTATPNGPSLATSPDPGHNSHQQQLSTPTLAQQGQPHTSSHQTNLASQPSGTQPINMSSGPNSGTLPIHLAYSPRTTRRNMLSTELTESLRKNLLWERQHRSTGNLAALLKRRATPAASAGGGDGVGGNLRQLPEGGPVFTEPRQQVQLGVGGVVEGGGNAVANVTTGAGGLRGFNNDFFNQGLQEYHAKGW